MLGPLLRRLLGSRPMTKERVYDIMFKRTINLLVFTSVVGFSYTIIRGGWWVLYRYPQLQERRRAYEENQVEFEQLVKEAELLMKKQDEDLLKDNPVPKDMHQ